MKTKLKQSGNSLAFRIPGHLAAEMGWKAGTAVDLGSKAGKLLVSSKPQKKYRLRGLVEGVTDKNRHTEQWAEPDQGSRL